ncbi:MAG: ABC transporter substrate-binding protein [Steroidobacteraceae bacterium]|jgi:phospholipid transport system substrate-binding protein|nr:ABC transporter substrate-binding protein [Steroidobacteraceae bacterium]
MIRSIPMLALAFTLASPPAATQEVPGPPPQQLIEQASQQLLDALAKDREAVRKNPAKAKALVDQYLLPHFDTDYSARLVLGTHWRNATPKQRERFVDAFYQSMLYKYGTALADFTSDKLTILPFRGDLSSGRATVRTEVTTSDGTKVPVHYTLRATPQGWKAWDVTIEGISYVRNFREDVGAEVSSKGLEAVIARLETENAAHVAQAARS